MQRISWFRDMSEEADMEKQRLLFSEDTGTIFLKLKKVIICEMRVYLWLRAFYDIKVVCL